MAPKNVKSVGSPSITNFFTKSTSQRSQPSSSLDSKRDSSKHSQPKPIATSQTLKSQDVIMVGSSDDEIVNQNGSAKARKSEGGSKSLDASTKPKQDQSMPTKMEVDENESPQRISQKRKKLSVLMSSSEDEGDEHSEANPARKKAAIADGSTSKPKARISLPSNKADEDYEMTSSEHEPAVSKTQNKGKAPVKKSGWQMNASGSKVKTTIPPKKGTKKDNGTEATGKGKDKAAAPGPKRAKWVPPKAHGPVAPGSKTVPDGDENCLLGLSFVFTGELSSFSREEAIDISKRFGGRVVGQPSSKTDYVVLGEDAGSSKLKAIEKHGLKTLSEDQFLDLIANRKGNGKGLDEKTRKKMKKEQEAIKAVAKEMEKKEKEAQSHAGSSKIVDPSFQLWTTRYAPQSLKDICGNKSAVEKLELWLKDWPQSYKSGFKKPGKNLMNMYRAVLISGSPGIGKTTSAHLCAKLAGYTPIELNASDTRSKKLVENGLNINNTTLDGFIGGGSAVNSNTVVTDRTCLIMDEVDGMSAGDRGGVGALNAMIKKSKIPIICIANDRQAQKLKPLMSTTFNLSFSKPQASSIRSRMLSIAHREKLKIPANVIDQLIAGAQSDIRQVLNMMSTVKLRSDSLTFDEGKELTKMNEKYTIMSPFDLTSKILGPYLFSHTARETLGDKMELYFQDHSLVPLFIQENYLKTQPAKVRNEEGPEKEMRMLQLMDKAVSSISDGDLVDALIHGPEQHWSLMPLHAVCSTIRPASFLYGTGAHYGGANSISFPQWLGQNSKQNKLSRQLSDIQVRMRLKVSGDKNEIRQSYIPALHPHVVFPLVEEGSAAVDRTIERMDDYYLSKEDWDTIVELGVGDQKDDLILKKISAPTKSAFTRKYNSSDHPIPFHKATDLGKAPKKLAVEQVPDLEEAFGLDEVIEDASDDEKSPQDTEDIDKDRLIQHTKKKVTVGKGKAKK